MSKHIETLQNSLKKYLKQQGTTLEVMGDKFLRISCKTMVTPPHLNQTLSSMFQAYTHTKNKQITNDK